MSFDSSLWSFITKFSGEILFNCVKRAAQSPGLEVMKRKLHFEKSPLPPPQSKKNVVILLLSNYHKCEH